MRVLNSLFLISLVTLQFAPILSNYTLRVKESYSNDRITLFDADLNSNTISKHITVTEKERLLKIEEIEKAIDKAALLHNRLDSLSKQIEQKTVTAKNMFKKEISVFSFFKLISPIYILFCILAALLLVAICKLITKLKLKSNLDDTKQYNVESNTFNFNDNKELNSFMLPNIEVKLDILTNSEDKDTSFDQDDKEYLEHILKFL